MPRSFLVKKKEKHKKVGASSGSLLLPTDVCASKESDYTEELTSRVVGAQSLPVTPEPSPRSDGRSPPALSYPLSITHVHYACGLGSPLTPTDTDDWGSSPTTRPTSSPPFSPGNTTYI